MGQEYSNPRRANDPHALPDLEVFEITEEDIRRREAPCSDDDGEEPCGPGFYWWACFPGCLPNGPPIGPFDSYAEALADAREGVDDDEVEP